MGKPASRGMLYIVVCAAPPAAELQDLVKLAQAAGWEVAVTATPDALAFIDTPLLAAITGYPVRHRWREPDEPESVPEANAIVVAPATFNTINKWVAGIERHEARTDREEVQGLLRLAVAAAGVKLGQPDPEDAGEGGQQPRQRRDAPVLPDGAGPASMTGRCT
jgi:phosphopantothenoylcysteine decarboxylase